MGEALVYRQLGPGDELALDAFCAAYRATTMFFASNRRTAPLGSSGHRRAGVYAGAFEGGELVGVVAHYEMGSLVSRAGAHALELARRVLAQTGRPCSAFVGPEPEVDALCEALAPADLAWGIEGRELLFELPLAQLRAPAMDSGQARPAELDDLDTLAAWSVDYALETLGSTRSEAMLARERELMRGNIEAGRTWVLEADGERLAMTSFNAQIPEAVQVGGVWTPPALRGRGYASQVVAAHLAHARDQGATTAILFTQVENAPAIAVYRKLGFVEIGRYRLALPREPFVPRLD